MKRALVKALMKRAEKYGKRADVAGSVFDKYGQDTVKRTSKTLKKKSAAKKEMLKNLDKIDRIHRYGDRKVKTKSGRASFHEKVRKGRGDWGAIQHPRTPIKHKRSRFKDLKR